MLSVRVVTADHYMAAPIPGLDVTYSEFRASEIEQVPVIRVFGTNSQGLKTCVHIHGVFPYICIPYDSLEPHTKLSYQIAISLDKAINISLGNSNSQTKHVHKIVHVSGIPFYGYHGKEHQFLKVYFYKPAIMKKAISLLENGAVLNRIFQPHEAHVSFLLQFFIDFNLHGMSFIHFANGRYRNTGSSAMEDIPVDLLMPDTVKPVSFSKLEADVVSSDILNPTTKQVGDGVVNPGLAAILEDEKQRRLEDGVTATPRLHSQRLPQPPTDSDLYYREKIRAKLESLPSSLESLSSDSPSNSRISYPSETPAGRNILEASFVNVHSGQLDRTVKEVSREPDLDESVVDIEVVKNLSSSQASERLHYSQLDQEDLELMEILENLAHCTTQAVEADSVLGTQRLETGGDPGNVEVADEDEGDKWLDRTLVSEEVDEENRPDTPSREDNESQHSNQEEERLWEDSFWNGVNSSYLLNEDTIPQLDGALEDEDFLSAGAPTRRRIGSRGRVPTGSRNSVSRQRGTLTGGVRPPEQEAQQPEAQQPEAQQMVAQQPVAQQPVAQQPVAQQPEAQQPVAQQPEAPPVPAPASTSAPAPALALTPEVARSSTEGNQELAVPEQPEVPVQVAFQGDAPESVVENIVDLENHPAGSSVNCPEKLLFEENGCGSHLTFGNALTLEPREGGATGVQLDRFAAGVFNVPLAQGGLSLDDFCPNENTFLLNAAELAHPEGEPSQQPIVYYLPSDYLNFMSEADRKEAAVNALQLGNQLGDIALVASDRGDGHVGDGGGHIADEGGDVAQTASAVVEGMNDEASSIFSSNGSPNSRLAPLELTRAETGLLVGADSFQDEGTSVLLGDPSLYQQYSSPARRTSSGNNRELDAETWSGVSLDTEEVLKIANACTPSKSAQGISSKPISINRRSNRTHRSIKLDDSDSGVSKKLSTGKDVSLNVIPPAAASTPLGSSQSQQLSQPLSQLSLENAPSASAQQDQAELDASNMSPCSCMDDDDYNDGLSRFEGWSANMTHPRSSYSKGQSEKDYERLRQNRMDEILAGPSNEVSPLKDTRTQELQEAVKQQAQRRCKGRCSRALTKKGSLPSAIIPPLLWACEDDIVTSDSEDSEDSSPEVQSKKMSKEEAFADAFKTSQKILKLTKHLERSIRRHRLSLPMNRVTMAMMATRSAPEPSGKKSRVKVTPPRWRGKPSSASQLRQLLDCSVRIERLNSSSVLNLSSEHNFNADSILSRLSSPELARNEDIPVRFVSKHTLTKTDTKKSTKERRRTIETTVGLPEPTESVAETPKATGDAIPVVKKRGRGRPRKNDPNRPSEGVPEQPKRQLDRPPLGKPTGSAKNVLSRNVGLSRRTGKSAVVHLNPLLPSRKEVGTPVQSVPELSTGESPSPEQVKVLRKRSIFSPEDSPELLKQGAPRKTSTAPGDVVVSETAVPSTSAPYETSAGAFTEASVLLRKVTLATSSPIEVADPENTKQMASTLGEVSVNLSRELCETLQEELRRSKRDSLLLQSSADSASDSPLSLDASNVLSDGSLLDTPAQEEQTRKTNPAAIPQQPMKTSRARRHQASNAPQPSGSESPNSNAPATNTEEEAASSAEAVLVPPVAEEAAPKVVESVPVVLLVSGAGKVQESNRTTGKSSQDEIPVEVGRTKKRKPVARSLQPAVKTSRSKRGLSADNSLNTSSASVECPEEPPQPLEDNTASRADVEQDPRHEQAEKSVDVVPEKNATAGNTSLNESVVLLTEVLYLDPEKKTSLSRLTGLAKTLENPGASATVSSSKEKPVMADAGGKISSKDRSKTPNTKTTGADQESQTLPADKSAVISPGVMILERPNVQPQQETDNSSSSIFGLVTPNRHPKSGRPNKLSLSAQSSNSSPGKIKVSNAVFGLVTPIRNVKFSKLSLSSRKENVSLTSSARRANSVDSRPSEEPRPTLPSSPSLPIPTGEGPSRPTTHPVGVVPLNDPQLVTPSKLPGSVKKREVTSSSKSKRSATPLPKTDVRESLSLTPLSDRFQDTDFARTWQVQEKLERDLLTRFASEEWGSSGVPIQNESVNKSASVPPKSSESSSKVRTAENISSSVVRNLDFGRSQASDVLDSLIVKRSGSRNDSVGQAPAPKSVPEPGSSKEMIAPKKDQIKPGPSGVTDRGAGSSRPISRVGRPRKVAVVDDKISKSNKKTVDSTVNSDGKATTSLASSKSTKTVGFTMTSKENSGKATTSQASSVPGKLVLTKQSDETSSPTGVFQKRLGVTRRLSAKRLKEQLFGLDSSNSSMSGTEDFKMSTPPSETARESEKERAKTVGKETSHVQAANLKKLIGNSGEVEVVDVSTAVPGTKTPQKSSPEVRVDLLSPSSSKRCPVPTQKALEAIVQKHERIMKRNSPVKSVKSSSDLKDRKSPMPTEASSKHGERKSHRDGSGDKNNAKEGTTKVTKPKPMTSHATLPQVSSPQVSNPQVLAPQGSAPKRPQSDAEALPEKDTSSVSTSQLNTTEQPSASTSKPVIFASPAPVMDKSSLTPKTSAKLPAAPVNSVARNDDRVTENKIVLVKSKKVLEKSEAPNLAPSSSHVPSQGKPEPTPVEKRPVPEIKEVPVKAGQCDTTGSPVSSSQEADTDKPADQVDLNTGPPKQGDLELEKQNEQPVINPPPKAIPPTVTPSQTSKTASTPEPQPKKPCQRCSLHKRSQPTREESSSSSSEDSSSDSEDSSSSTDSTSTSSEKDPPKEKPAPIDEEGKPMIAVKKRAGPASKTVKYVKAVTEPDQRKTNDQETVSSTLKSPKDTVEERISSPKVTEEVARRADSPVSSTTPKTTRSPILELSPPAKMRVVARKRKLKMESSESSSSSKKLKGESSERPASTQVVAQSPNPNVSTTGSPREVRTGVLPKEDGASSREQQKITKEVGSPRRSSSKKTTHEENPDRRKGGKKSAPRSVPSTSRPEKSSSSKEKNPASSLKSRKSSGSSRPKAEPASKKLRVSEFTSELDGTSLKITSMGVHLALPLLNNPREWSEELDLWDNQSQSKDDSPVHRSIENNCAIEYQIPYHEPDISVRAKKKLQFSFQSESPFEFEESTDIDKNDMTLGLPLSPADGDSVSSEHSSADMFEETVLERTLCEKMSPDPNAQCFFIPVSVPPTRSEVLASLPSLDIPETVNPTPYFSNYQDVKKKKEVGGHILHLSSRNVVDLEEFQSSVVTRGIKDHQKALFELVLDARSAKRSDVVSSLVSDRTVYITPVKRPPSVREVVLWEKARAILKAEKSVAPKPIKVMKVSAPLSPGVSQDSDDSFNISQSSIEITTPESSKDTQHSTQHSTPQSESSKASDAELPHLKTTPILRQHRSTKALRRRARRSSVEPTLAAIKEDSNESVPSPDSQDSSLRRLLLSSQFKNQVSPLNTNVSDISCLQIEGLNRSKDFRVPLENLQQVRNTSEHQFTTLLILELHIGVCGELKPDPERDPIRAVFYTVVNDVPEDSSVPRQLTGIIAVDTQNPSTPLLSRIGIDSDVTYVTDEVSLLKEVVDFVREWDPDIVAGYEIEMLSWGYLIDRSNTFGINMRNELARVATNEAPKQNKRGGADSEGDTNFHGGLSLIGRIVIDVWRLMRNEVALQSYSFENIAYHILHQRMPVHSFASLSFWWEHSSHLFRWRTAQHYLRRVVGIARILDQLDFIGRTSELARLFGIQFFEVLSRGSQFRVESMMLRLAKPSNFVPISPSVQQRARMRAPEMLPLIMEPESRFYSDPVIVLDFQSLYPSMIIAYNYCFSTCLGRVEHLGKPTHFEFGCCHLYIPPRRLQKLEKQLTVSPCGVAFVKPKVRRGILPQMLEEILEARLAVKDSMKRHKDNRTLQRVLHARQLGLKLIANVTYGYTSANFSGRMPCIEVGDSVVSKGRETLERAITTVHGNPEWRARVVYGDTDSLFVLVPGRSRREAFRIGAEIADAVTQQNPSPVKLKLEKVYQPCILQTKKRYVGYMYENPNQKEPVYDAKGIETVRRDGCPAVAKMLEKTLRILFETANVSLVKNYVCRQFTKMFKGRTNLQDFIYAKEYRGMANYRPGACVPALELTRRWLTKDRRSEPRISERVPYVIVSGPPGLPLIHLVRSPRDLLVDPGLRLNVVYYITRAIIPPLDRCLALIGADVLSWYTDLPRKKAYMYTVEGGQANARKNTISQYFCTVECVCCGQLTNKGICVDCRKRPQEVAVQLSEKLHSWEHAYNTVNKVCQSCIGSMEEVNCVSLDCPILYRRLQASREFDHSAFIRRLKDECLHSG